MRLQFPTGCVANLTASRVSTEKVRKAPAVPAAAVPFARLRPPGPVYLQRQSQRQVTPEPVFVTKIGTLAESTWMPSQKSIRSREIPKTSGARARQTLGVALSILDKIKEHSELVSKSLAAGWKR